MQLKEYLLIIVGFVFVFACSSGESKDAADTIDFNSFRIKKVAPVHYLKLGKLTKAVKLQTTEESVIGNIDQIRIDKKSGDIFIADKSTTKKIHRFSKSGNYITSYGAIGAGPQEYNYLRGFCLDHDSNLFIIGDTKLMKFNSSGVFLKGVRLNGDPREIEIVQGKIFIYMTGYFKREVYRKALHIYNFFLNYEDGIGVFDSRLDKYAYFTFNYCAASISRLYFADYYDLAINVYDINTKKLFRLRFPNQNADLDNIWGKKSFTEADRTEIKKRLHNFSSVFSFGNDLFLLEFYYEKKNFNAWRVNIDKKEITVYPLTCFFKDPEVQSENQLYINGIIGSYEQGIMVMFCDPGEFNKYKSGMPIFKEMELDEDDNPIIAFFEFKDELTR